MKQNRWQSRRFTIRRTGDGFTLTDDSGQRFMVLGDELHALAAVVKQAIRARRRPRGVCRPVPPELSAEFDVLADVLTHTLRSAWWVWVGVVVLAVVIAALRGCG